MIVLTNLYFRTILPSPLSLNSIYVSIYAYLTCHDFERKKQVKIGIVVFVHFWSGIFKQMQMTNWGRGVTFGQRVGLSFCDELKIRRSLIISVIISSESYKFQNHEEFLLRGLKVYHICRIGNPLFQLMQNFRFYSEPGIRGGKKCKLWTERTCCCLSFSGNKPEGWAMI